MKKNLFLLTIVMVFCASSIMAQRPHDQIEFPEINRFQMPDVVTFETRNGIKFYLVENPELPLINMSVLIRAGSFMDPAEKAGLASFTGQLIRGGGTAKHSYDDLNTLLENRAASMETSFGFDRGNASMSVLKEDFDSLLPVFIDLIQNPVFPENRIDVVKTQTRSSIARRNDNAGVVANREFRKLIYGANSVFTRQVEYASVDAISRDDMVAFHRNVMVGRNMYVAVIGDFRARDMRRSLERAFGQIPAGTANQLNIPKVDYEFTPGINFIAKNDVNQSNILLGHIGGLRNNPDFAALQLMNEILSGGFSGRLMQEIRSNQGLSYSVGGAYQSLPLYEGVFSVSLGTASANTARAVKATMEEIRKLQQDGVTERELQDARDRILNSLVFRYDSRAAVLNERISNEYNGLPADAFNRYIDELQKVTVSDVNRVAKQYLRSDALQVLIVGNENEMGYQLEEFENVNRIDITIPRPESARTEAKGDEAEGRVWLNRMAASLMPDGEVSTVTFDGTVNLGGMNIRSKTTINFPDAMSQELNLPQGIITLEYQNGVGKMLAGGQEQALPPVQVEALQKDLSRHYLNVALRANDLGSELVEINSDGKAVVFIPELGITLLISQETGLPAGLRVKEFNPMVGAEVEVQNLYSDWTLSDGVYMAYTTRIMMDGNEASVSTITTHSVE